VLEVCFADFADFGNFLANNSFLYSKIAEKTSISGLKTFCARPYSTPTFGKADLH